MSESNFSVLEILSCKKKIIIERRKKNIKIKKQKRKKSYTQKKVRIYKCSVYIIYLMKKKKNQNSSLI